jgi:predicted ATPase
LSPEPFFWLRSRIIPNVEGSMHLRELTLTNVRQFANRTFEFLPGINLLVGENGAGKTTLLRSIVAVLGSTGGRSDTPILIDDDISLFTLDLKIDAAVSHSLNANAVYSYQREWGGRARRHRGADFPLILMYGSNESTCTSFVAHGKHRQSTRRRGLERFREEEWLYEEMERRPKAEGGTTRFGNSKEIRHFVSDVLSVFSPKFLRFSWVFEPYRCTIRQQQPGPVALEPRYKRLLTDAILRYLEERKRPLRMFEQSRFVIDSSGYPIGDKTEVRHLEPIPPFEELLKRFGKGNIPVAAFKNLVAEVHLTPRIRIATPTGQFQLSQMSDGEKRLFSIFVDIARQLSLARDGQRIADIPAIVLIDEVDVHLHPKWQRLIIPSLEKLFPACQFIATTHSPFVVQGVEESQVQHLDRPLTGDFTDRGIEEIAAKVMGIEDHDVSPRYLEMLDAAREYFRLLESAAKNDAEGNSVAVAKAKIDMDRLSARYARNPGYQAFLELNQQLRLG